VGNGRQDVGRSAGSSCYTHDLNCARRRILTTGEHGCVVHVLEYQHPKERDGAHDGAPSDPGESTQNLKTESDWYP
ncbi:hypothetical protein, partial [Photobacterium sp. DNB22_13_2]